MSLASVLPGHCDFEAGLCDYSQDKQDNGTDWEWRRGPTPTSYTGPRGDHTTGLGKETYCQFTEVHKIIDNNNNNKVVKYTNTLKKKNFITAHSSFPSPGHYLHMEASAMLPGQSIRLLSRPLRGSRGPQCLQFYYHMYGSGTGQLNLHLKYDSGDKLLWQQSGEQSITWLRATVAFQCDSLHQARAEKDM